MKGSPISGLPFDIKFVHSSSSSSVELEELAVAFALEALADDEIDTYRQHLEGCDLCRQLVGQFQTVANLLPDAMEPETASADLKARILTQAEKDSEGTVRASPEAIEELRGPRMPGWLAPIFRPVTPFRVALAIVAVAAVGVTLYRGLGDGDRQVELKAQVLDSIAEGAPVSYLAGTEPAMEASGILVNDPGQGRAFLLVNRLPKLPSDREYQVWRIKGDQPISAGTFKDDESEDQIIIVEGDFADADAIGISIEPAGGSPTPTGLIVLLGNIQA